MSFSEVSVSAHSDFALKVFRRPRVFIHHCSFRDAKGMNSRRLFQRDGSTPL